MEEVFAYINETLLIHLDSTKEDAAETLDYSAHIVTREVEIESVEASEDEDPENPQPKETKTCIEAYQFTWETENFSPST